MSSLFHWIVALALLATSARAQDPVALPTDAGRAHELAVEAYRAGDLDSAESLWLHARELDPGGEAVDRSSVAYNLGNVAFRRGAPVEAAAWYRTALRGRPRDADAWANLEFALAAAELPPADRGDLGDTLQRLLHALNPREAAGLAVIGAGLLALALSWEAVRGGLVARRIAWAALFLALLCAVPWFVGLRERDRSLAYVIAANGANVHSEPRRDAARLERLEAGAEVEQVDSMPGWVRVELADGVRGWVASEGALLTP